VKNAVVRGNTFADNFGMAVQWVEDPASGGSSVIERNVLTNTGTVEGYGGTGSWKNAGIVIASGTNVHAQYNRIDGAGYAGIILGSAGNFAEYNVIDDAMRTLNDGAAVYANASNATIRNNVIRDTRGGMDSSGAWANLAHGIWTEAIGDYRNQTIQHNTVVNSGGWGIYFDNNYASTIKDNVLFGNDGGQIELSGDRSKPAQGHVITGNVLVGTSAGELSLQFKRGVSYGTISGNQYLDGLTDRVVAAFDDAWSPFAAMTIAQWAGQYPTVADGQGRTLQDVLGGLAPTAPELFLNDTDAPMSFLLGKSYVDLQGRQYVGQLQLDALASLVLIPHPLYGDANLDGRVTLADRAMIRLGGLATWADGDFNHDGVVDADDLALFDRSYALYGNGAVVAFVPEPAIVVALIMPVALLSRRRRMSRG
jgi:parallel beta-helix repeat protein